MFDSMCRPKRLAFDASAAIYGKSMQGLLTANSSRRRRLTLGSAALGGAMLVVLACSDESSGNDGDPPGFALFVFPNEVEPLGQATVAVEVGPSACNDRECTICLGVPKVEGAGLLFGPPGAADPGGSPVVQLSTDDTNSLTSMTYQAPNREASEVISAALYERGKDCSNPDGTPLRTTTERVTIRRPSADSGSEGEGGAAGESNQGEGEP